MITDDQIQEIVRRSGFRAAPHSWINEVDIRVGNEWRTMMGEVSHNVLIEIFKRHSAIVDSKLNYIE